VVLIWGFRGSSVVVTTAVYVCDRCGTNAAHRLTKRVRRFTLFFVGSSNLRGRQDTIFVL